LRACALDINNSGVIVGYSRWNDSSYAVAWADGEIIQLGDGARGTAYAINDEGTIAGSVRAGEAYHAVIGDVTGWKVDLYDDVGWLSNTARGINEEGIVVGSVVLAWGDGFCTSVEAFIWDDGEVTMLWDLDPAHDVHYIPRDINGRLRVVGEKYWGWYMSCNAHDTNAWHWYAGEGVLLPNPNPTSGYSAARAINDADDEVGSACDSYGDYCCGTLWRDGVAYDLNDLIDPESEVHISGAYDIDDRGRILAVDFVADPYALLLLLPIKPGDIDEDGDVDTADLLALLAAWGPCEGCPEDIDGNGVVNTADLLILLANWG
jgi:uncharacterized membrane protein